MTSRLNPVSLIIMVALLCIVIAGGYFGFRFIINDKDEDPVAAVDEGAKPELKRMINLPPKEELVPPPPLPEYKPDAPILEQARNALRDGISPDDAFAMAKSLPDSPGRADAVFLLLEYAAEAGHSQAAMTVAGYYDPTHNTPSGTIRKNPATAFEWYQKALAAGQTDAKNDLETLRRWVSEKADHGSPEARDLLKWWPEDPS